MPCPQCLRQPEAKGRGHYSPRIGGATGVRAGDAVRNATAESTPQACELTARKRLIARRRREPPQLARIVSGAALYSPVPFVAQRQHLRQHSILVAKPSSPPTLVAAGAAADGTEPRQSGQWTAGSGTRRRTSP
jgi:hypothetical protein